MNAHAPIGTQTTPIEPSDQDNAKLTTQEAKDRKAAAQDVPLDKSHFKQSGNTYSKQDIIAAIQNSFETNEFFTDKFGAFWNGLGKEFSDFGVKKITPSASSGHAARFDMPALLHTAAHSMKFLQHSEEAGALFQSRNGKIQVLNGEIQFIPSADTKKSRNGKSVMKPMTYEDAFNAILLASTNKAMIYPNRLLIEGGSRAEQLMYMRAVKAYNATVPKELQFVTNKPAWDLSPVNGASKEFTKYMHRAQNYEMQHAVSQPDLPSEEDLAAFVNGADFTGSGIPPVAEKAPAPEQEAESSSNAPDKTAEAGLEVTTSELEKAATAGPAESAPPQEAPAPLAQAATSVAAPASTEIPQEERQNYIETKLGIIEQYITDNEKQVLKQPPVDKTGGTPARNVFLIQMDGYPNDKTYVAKIDGKLHVVLSHDDNNIGTIQHDDVYLQDDMEHAKHPLHRFAQITKEQKSFPIIGDGGAQIGPAEYVQTYRGYDEFQKSFQSAAAVERRTKAAIRAAAKLEENAPKPGAGSMG